MHVFLDLIPPSLCWMTAKGWRAPGGELFQDVNVPSKAFGELVENQRHTPSLSAQEVKALLDARTNVVVLDARRC